MKYVVTEEQVVRAWSLFFESFDIAKYRTGKTEPLPHMRAALEDFAHTLGEPVAVPDGWRLVPVDLTTRMSVRGKWALCDHSIEPEDFRRAWQEMLSAAPHHPTTENGCD